MGASSSRIGLKVRVIVGSKNPVKINSVKEAFSKYFSGVEVEGVSVSSGVPDQPIGYEETLLGACNRAAGLEVISKGDYYVGLEGGIENKQGEWFSYGVMCILSKEGQRGIGITPAFPLPSYAIDEINKGRELGDVTDDITKGTNEKQKGGIIGFFTKGKMGRTELYVHGLTMALVPFVNKELYFKTK